MDNININDLKLFTVEEVVKKVKLSNPNFNRDLLYYYKKKMTEGRHYIRMGYSTFYTPAAIDALRTKYENDL